MRSTSDTADSGAEAARDGSTVRAANVAAPPPSTARRAKTVTIRRGPQAYSRGEIRFLPLVLLALGLLVTLSIENWRRGWISFPLESRQTLTPPTAGAPGEIVDRGICPGEYCMYGERWKAERNVDVYASPPREVGAEQSTLKKTVTLRAGQWVETQTGLMLARRGEGRVDSNNTFLADQANNQRRLRSGEVVPIYFALGEGCYRSWIDGRLTAVCALNVQREPQSEWWIQIKAPDGGSGWTGSPDAFVSKERLNDRLAEKIRDKELAPSEKLARIDDLLKDGAALNGTSTKHGEEPISAAISGGDVDLLGALFKRGLTVRGEHSCPAYYATQSALRPGGDAVLEFLLDNDMDLECLNEPALIAFLQSGIATQNYPVEQAVRVARVLVAHGAKVDRRDRKGQSILDVVRKQAGSNPRMAPLVDELTRMSSASVGFRSEPAVPRVTPPSTQRTKRNDSARRGAHKRECVWFNNQYLCE